MTLDLLPKPKRFLIFGGWILIKECNCGSVCRGHILALTPLYESGEKIDIYLCDIYQWNKVMEQELLAYGELINPSTEEGSATEVEEPPLVERYQAQPEEVLNDNKFSPKEKKPYTGRKKPRLYIKIFGE